MNPALTRPSASRRLFASIPRSARSRIVFAAALAALAAGGFYLVPSSAALLVAPESPPTSSLEAVVTKVEEVKPGTAVGETAPEGWSHLVIKSQPGLKPVERGKVMDLTARMVEFIFTVIVADVGSEQAGGRHSHFLKRVALGMGAEVNGKDVVMDPDAHDRAAEGGFVEKRLRRRVFGEVYAKQGMARLAGATRTMGVLDTVAVLNGGGRNRQVVIRYALLVDPDSGKLNTLCWVVELDKQGKYNRAVGPIEWLPENKLSDAAMVADEEEGLGSELQFGLAEPPQGQEKFEIPGGMRELAGAAGFEGEQLLRLEAACRGLVGAGGE